MTTQWSQRVEQDGQQVQHAACYHEQVKDAVHVPALRPQAVEDRAHGIGHAARQDEPEAGPADGPEEQRGFEDNGPADGDVADHGKDPVAAQVDGRQHRGQDGERPDQTTANSTQLETGSMGGMALRSRGV